jgi:hypothetical protein
MPAAHAKSPQRACRHNNAFAAARHFAEDAVPKA